MDADRTPVLIGVGQLANRDVELDRAPNPLDTLEAVSAAAAEDSGAGRAALESLDSVALVSALGWRPSNGPGLLAERLGVHPSTLLSAGVGGETSVLLLSELADRIRTGRSRSALLATTHNLRTRALARDAGVELAWPEGGTGQPELITGDSEGSSERESAYGLQLPSVVYPIFENALRARRGLDPKQHNERIGALFASFTRVAAKNPYAWYPIERSAEELVTPSASNRMIVYPYTKYLNAVMWTDQAAALLVCSVRVARSLGVPESRWVYWHGGATAREHPWFPTERPDLAACPSLRACVEASLERAAASLDAVDCFDFYSCFPSAVEMACEMLGLAEDDARGLTVTGGLPYAGGPGNGYGIHAAASMVERLRAAPGSRGLATGNGWYLTKHSACVLASAPPEHALSAPSEATAPQQGSVAFADRANGTAQLESYAVTYDRTGAPERGVAVGRLDDGRRFLAHIPADRALLEDLVAREGVGRAGRVSFADGSNRFEPA